MAETENEVKFVNLLPHAVNLIAADGSETVIPPSGSVARCESKASHETIHGVRFARTTWLGVFGLPDPEPDTIFIVSMLVAQNVRRPDVVSPDSGRDAIRNEAGQIAAVRGFCRFD